MANPGNLSTGISEASSNGIGNGVGHGLSNGTSNGLSNGTSNGHSNGITNGTTNGMNHESSPPKTGIKVIIVGAGKNTLFLSYTSLRACKDAYQFSSRRY